MSKLSRMPLRWRLTLLVTMVSTLTLVVAFGGYFVLEVISIREKTQESFAALVDQFRPKISELSRLSEPDPQDRQIALQENNKMIRGVVTGFTLDADVLVATVYSPTGIVLAHYAQFGSQEALGSLKAQVSSYTNFSTNQVVLIKPFKRDDGSLVGTLFIRGKIPTELSAKLTEPLRVFGILALLSLLGGMIASRVLQRGISDPITKLASLAQRVARDGDYATRADIKAGGETGVLVDAFNGMLSTIQQRDAEVMVAKNNAEQARERLAEINALLEESNRTLEAKVADRTKELQKATDAARDANQAKSSFLAKMSHELRTPMNAIIGYSEILIEDSSDRGDKGAVTDLNKILSAARHLLGLINDVLDLSKIEAGRMDLYLETFDISTIVNEVITTVQPLVDRNKNKLVLECATNLGQMHADATKMRQMMLNLLSNASKFTSAGEIRLIVSKERSADSQEWVVIRVRDSGIGMTPEQMGKLFQAFSQAEQSTQAKYGGTGLGLVISRQFARLMAGDITVESESGKGSTFIIRVPQRVAQPKVTPLATEAPAPNLSAAAGTDVQSAQALAQRRGRVLIVHSEKAMLDQLNKLFSGVGYRVTAAHTASEGVALAQATRPHVVILDMMLPGEGGGSALAMFKAHNSLVTVPIILLGGTEELNSGFALGATDYVCKPVDASRLLSILAKHSATQHDTPVLVVEDDAPTREMIVRLLKREGWNSIEAENGRVALEMLRKHNPSVVLLDLLMPEVDGFAVLRAMRTEALWRDIPVVVLTSLDLTAEIRRFLEQQAERVLQKGSYTREDLLKEVRDSVDEFMRRRSLSDPPFAISSPAATP